MKCGICGRLLAAHTPPPNPHPCFTAERKRAMRKARRDAESADDKRRRTM